MQTSMRLLPPNFQHVTFADKEGKQCICKLVRLPDGANECPDRKGDSPRESANVDSPTRRVNYAGPSVR
ncbi:unnamed protein product, partial [Tuber aestivum]